MKLTVRTRIQLWDAAAHLHVLGRVCLIICERVEECVLSGRGLIGLALHTSAVAIVKDGVKGTLVDAVAHGHEVVQRGALVVGRWACQHRFRLLLLAVLEINATRSLRGKALAGK